MHIYLYRQDELNLRALEKMREEGKMVYKAPGFPLSPLFTELPGMDDNNWYDELVMVSTEGHVVLVGQPPEGLENITDLHPEDRWKTLLEHMEREAQRWYDYTIRLLSYKDVGKVDVTSLKVAIKNLIKMIHRVTADDDCSVYDVTKAARLLFALDHMTSLFPISYTRDTFDVWPFVCTNDDPGVCAVAIYNIHL